MSDGGALLVQKNNLHDAFGCVPGVEAYAWSPAMCAASTEQHSDLFAGPSFYWRQYIDAISRNGLGLAVLSAWGLRWSCICEDFQNEFMCLSTGCSDVSPLDRVQHDDPFTIDFTSQMNDTSKERGTVCSVAAFSADQPHLLHGDSSRTSPEPVSVQLNLMTPSSKSLISCLRKSKFSLTASKSVQFDAKVLLHIGLDDEIEMATVMLCHDDLQGWTRKPKKNKDLDGETGTEEVQAFSPSFELPALDSRMHDYSDFHGRESDVFSLQQRIDLTHCCQDETILVQTARQVGKVFKNEPINRQNIDMVSAFQEGHVYQGDGDAESHNDSPQGSEGYSPSEGPASPVARTPSSDNDRQDVILFHLQDMPIRALITWSNYEDMMTEIAHHFALVRDALVDAYEVVVPPPDLEPGIAPIIVHVVNDIPHHTAGRLVLLDIAYHAHRVEMNFQSGPTVSRQVLPLPRHVNRNELLACAKVERYCRAENGRCLVFINSRRWPDYDVDRKTIADGDYIKIAVPPSERFTCPTEVITELTQRGFTDQQILDEIFNDEAVSDVSPDMLNDEEVRQLAAPRHPDGDVALLMQLASSSNVDQPVSQSLNSRESTESVIPQDWLIDLQRIVSPLERCDADVAQEFLFSVYTWLVDHQNEKICKEPKVVVLGGNPSEWEEDIRQPWQHLLEHREHVFFDLAAPTARRSDLEEHVAHIILTRNHNDKSSVLISIEFVASEAPSVVVRFAAVLPKKCTTADVTLAIPLLTAFSLNPVEWVVPSLKDNHQSFDTWSGMGLIAKVLPHPEGHLIDGDDEEHSLLQFQVNGMSFVQSHLRSLVGNPLLSSESQCDSQLGYKILPFQRQMSGPSSGNVKLSLTEEFIRYVQAVGSQVDNVDTNVPMPDGLQDQPLWIQDLWEKWAETLAQTGGNPEDGPRIETWFSNPRRWSSCANSRIVVLSTNYQHWERELLAAWPDKADLTLPTQYAIVFPTPDDADRTAQEQLVIEQQSEPFSRTVVATLYDTDWDGGRPSSIALVAADRLDVRSFITMMGYSELCSPEHERNECLMWMGNIAIHQDQTINVRLGNAFKLLVRRGIKVSVQELLSMSDHRLRSELQSAIGGYIFRRPNIQGFPSDANALNNPTTQEGSLQQSRDDYPPDWLNSLQECFDRCAVVETAAEGRAIYVLVWFLHGDSFLRNESPRAVRLDADNQWWRSELLFPWRDQFARGYQIDVHFVDPIPVSESWQSHVAHVIVTQAMPQEHVPVVVTTVERGRQEDIYNHAALVVHQFSSAQNIADRFERIRSRQDGFTVSRGRNVFPTDLTVRIGSGDGLILRIESRGAGSSSDATASAHADQYAHTDQANSHEDALEDPGDDLEDAFLMQAFHNVHVLQTIDVNHECHNSAATCALGLSDEGREEEAAFQFNPAAPIFLPSAHVLPAWAQVIEDIYHDWDIHAFAWQGEARATHFMTWYLAPGINRFQCLHGRKIALFADFWNWREQFRRKWIDEIDPGAELEVVYVSPPPTQMEAGVVGHIILLQHNSVEWSSILLSIYDPAINAGYPFKTALAFTEQLHFQQILARIGYANECIAVAQCHFRLRGQNFLAHDQIRASDGDAIDLLVQRVVAPVNWNPPIVPHMPGAEGLALIQKSFKRLSKRQLNQDDNDKATTDHKVISLADSIGTPDDDIAMIPFTLATLFQQSVAQDHDLVICAWEMPGNADILMCPNSGFNEEQSKSDFSRKHSLIKKCSDLHPVKYTRTQWAIAPDRWYVGSFAAPDALSAIVACVEYDSSGAIANVNTVPKYCRTDFLRSVLNIRFGTLIRRNGQFVGEDANYEHGDLIEYHVGHQQQLIIDKRCDKVQICLDSVLEHVAPHFDIEADAVEVLPYPSIQKDLCNEDAWAFQLIPEGTPLHKETFEALHCQRALDNSTAYRYELYIDGATSNGLSAWAVVAVSVFGDERCFLGCVAGLTEINQSSPKWIGALNHTNIDAELSAMAVATAFAFFASGEAQVLIRPDLALSQQFLNIQSTTRQLSTLARVIHVLGLSKPSGVDVQEVRAHRGDPWNELADAIARHVVATGKEVGSIPWTWLNQIATSPSTIKWEWIRQETPSFHQTMPSLHGDAVWQPTPSPKQVRVRVDGHDLRSHSVEFSLKVATYNGLALNDDSMPNPQATGRVARLDMQFHRESIAMIGIQEARTSEGCRVSENYRIFSSGYQQCGKTKHFGCELWIHKTLPFCTLPDGRKTGLKNCKLTVLVQEPRLLIACIEGPVAITAVVAHAPCVSADRPVDLVSLWWHTLSQRINMFPHENTIVLIDANAPLADRETKFFGLHQTET